VVPPQLNCASQQFHLRGHNHKTALLANGETPVSFSLTLSGGFDMVPECRLPLSQLAARICHHLLILINTLLNIAFDALTIHYTLKSVKFCSKVAQFSHLPHIPTLLELVIEPPADIIGIALQSLENATPQTIDFMDIAKFLRTELDNFPGLKTTMIDEVGYTLLALISE